LRRRWTKPLRGGERALLLRDLCGFFIVDLFYDSVPERGDSLRESSSRKEAIMGILRDRMIEEMENRDSPAASNIFVLTFVEVLQVLQGSRSAFTACQDRKGDLSTIRTTQMTTAQTFHTENRPLYPLKHWLRRL
jgi:hypothetical protein